MLQWRGLHGYKLDNIKIEDISTDDGDLEDVFVQLTKH